MKPQSIGRDGRPGLAWRFAGAAPASQSQSRESLVDPSPDERRATLRRALAKGGGACYSPARRVWRCAIVLFSGEGRQCPTSP